MAYVLLSLLLFGASVMTHIIFCRRTTVPGLHTRAFGLIAFIFLGIYAIGQGGILEGHSLWDLPFKITAGVIFVLLIPVYLIFYVLTQLMSPSKKILLTIARRGSISYAEILACVEEEDFIAKRLSDLCAGGCVIQANGRYILTSEGQKIAATLNLMQFILGRNTGG